MRLPGRTRRLAALLAFAGSLSCRSSDITPAPSAPVIRSAFVDGIVLLEATLDGKRGWWILDSGYEYSLLDSATAQAAGVAVSAPTTVAQPGGSVTQGWARAVSLDLSGKPFRPDSLAVFSLQPLSPVVGKPITGLLGHDFFERNVITIDYAMREVRLASSSGWKPPAGATEVGIWLENGEPFLLATLWANRRSVPAKLKIDTGSLSGLGLNGSFVAQNSLFPPDWPRLPMEGIAVGGATRNFVGRLDSMSLGGVVISQPVAGWSEDLARVGDAGTLGAPILARFRVTFDYAHRRIFLEPTVSAAGRDSWEAAGMLIVEIPGGDVIVAQVIPGTPADSAGLEAGDALRSVNGTGVASLGLDSLRRHFRQPGRVDTVSVSRGGTDHTYFIRQAELLSSPTP